MTWGIIDGYGFTAVEIVKETASTIIYRLFYGGCETRKHKRRVLDWRGNESDAIALTGRLNAARDAKLDRARQSIEIYIKERDQILAQACGGAFAEGDAP